MNKYMLLLTLMGASHANASFYEGAKRGWFWFEEKIEKEDQPKELSPEEQVQAFKVELDDLRYKMFVDPSVENVQAYRLKEAEMWKDAHKLYNAWEQAGFLYPELRSSPNNVYAVKLDRQVKKEEEIQAIGEFLKDYDLILFRSGGCKYCEAFEPILKTFANRYQVKIEAISLDKSTSKYFENKDGLVLIQALGIKEYPAVIAVHKKLDQTFELTRGLVTLDELEQYCQIAIQYMKSKQ